MTFMRFNHIALRVKDINKMLEFYCHGLGLTEAFRIKNDDGSLRIVYLHISEGQYLELCLGGTEPREFDDKHTIGFRHICFTVENVAQSKKELESRGVIFESEILQMRDHNLAAYLFDPESNKIELVQTSTESPQYLFQQTLPESVLR
jgi:lactoylglutathione lyase